jgi:predicted Zn-dependent protease with MMP-like domain
MVTRQQFESLVEEALHELPQQFADLLENVVIVIEEEPSEEDLEVLDDDEDGNELLGIYRGIALPQRHFDMLPSLPDQIAIFRGPILRIAATRAQIVEEVRDTVIHELGHYFGLSDHDMVF